MAAPRSVAGAAPPRRRGAGFTLIEVLVALAAMAVLAGLAWRGLDGIARARDGSAAAVERTARLNTILAQWEQDLAALHDSGAVPVLAFDGQTLRLTRETDGGVALVAWALRSGRWQRWASPAATKVPDLQDHWLRSQQLLGNEASQVNLLEGVSEWQVYCFRGSAWTNCQSSGDVETAPPPAIAASGPAAVVPREAPPEGVRLVVTLGERGFTRDVAIAPQRP